MPLTRVMLPPKRKLGREVHMTGLTWKADELDPTQGKLAVPLYDFPRPTYRWEETGSSTILAEGTSLGDGSNVLAKLAETGSAGALILEREVFLLARLGQNLEASAKTMRVVDYFVIPPEQGNVVVLILKHPGHNLLSTFFPASDEDTFLCHRNPTPHGEGGLSSEEMSMVPKEVTRDSPSASGAHTPSGMVVDEQDEADDTEEPTRMDAQEQEDESHTEIDIASFLEFAVQASHCVEILHTHNISHREIRPNAFHWNSSSGVVRWAHLGNRSLSLEGLGGPSDVVVEAETLGELERKSVKDALCYLAPEQTGRVQFTTDHRTDLYQLGITFYTILSGAVPFSGSSVDVFQSIVSETPRKLHDVRPDVPKVVSQIVAKLIGKDPDSRYRSSVGLKADLVRCQQALQALDIDGPSSSELIPPFPIAAEDKWSEFILPNTLFGRTKEVEILKAVLKRVSSTHSLHYSGGRRAILPNSSSAGGVATQSGSMLTPHNPATTESLSDAGSSHPSNSPSNEGGPHQLSKSPSTGLHPAAGGLARFSRGEDIAEEGEGSERTSSVGANAAGSTGGSSGRIRKHGNAKERLASARAVVISGVGGVGKSSLVLECQTAVRAAGFYGLAKFDATETSPYSAILTCLSFVFQQLITEYSSDITTFFAALKKRLGPQLRNVQLLFLAVPALKELTTMFGLAKLPPVESLPTQESRARFHSLVIDCISVLASVRMLTMVFDDLHYADAPSLGLIRSLAGAKIRMLIIATHRPENETFVSSVRDIFGSGARATYITLEPLSIEAVASIVSGTLHQPTADIMPFVNVLYRYTRGNPFSTRNLLVALKRHKNLFFDWRENIWRYNLQSIENDFFPEVAASTDEGDVEFLISHLNDLAPDVQRFLLWASLFGGTFKIKDVVHLVDSEETSGDDSEEDIGQRLRLSRGSMNGLQTALAEGWIINKGRDLGAFTHDRYRQAAYNLGEHLQADEIQSMSLKIVSLLLAEPTVDFFQVAEHVLKCISLLQTVKNIKYQRILRQAGDLALSQGAHEMALRYFDACQQLLGDQWSPEDDEEFDRIFELRLCVAELLTWKGEAETSNKALADLLARCTRPTHIAAIYRADSRNKWSGSDPGAQLRLLLKGLAALGVHISEDVSKSESNALFTKLHDEIVSRGVDTIAASGRCTDEVIILATAIIAEASTAAFWASGDGLQDMLGLTLVELALKHGMTPSSCLGFLWSAGAASEAHDQFKFAIECSQLSVRLADLHSTSAEIGQVHLLYGACVAPFDGSPLRGQLDRFELSTKHSMAAGDRQFSCFGLLHLISAKLEVNVHLSDVLLAAEEVIEDVASVSTGTGTILMVHGTAGCIKALAGQTINLSPETVLDDEGFVEAVDSFDDQPVPLHWYNSFKMCALWSMGWHEAAAELGFANWDTKYWHPNHYHVRMGIYYHSLALVRCLRDPQPDEIQIKYREQIKLNQAFIGRWLETGAINFLHWTTLVDAEVASLDGDTTTAFRLYDLAVKYARDGDWESDCGWALWLSGCHFVRSGVEVFGLELQQRGIQAHQRWGAFGIVNFLTQEMGGSMAEKLPGRHLVEMGVQTDRTIMTTIQPSTRPPLVSADSEDPTTQETSPDGLVFSHLTIDDLTAIIRSSQNISGDVNLPATLESLTEIVLENSGADVAHIVVKSDDGEYMVATSLTLPGSCVVYEVPIQVADFSTELFRSIVGHVLHSKETVLLSNAVQDPRFSPHIDPVAANSPKSVVCLPILAKGLVLGAIFLTSGRTNAFSPSNATVLSILAQQASISITTAQLFRKLQRATQANIRMIESQKKALEEARRSREDALRATKVKSNFLASMSHELRTPFSSFFGLLELLSETDLNREQRDFVQTAQASCALLLDIIDSLLDYSKLEAGAVKLEVIPFSPEEALADSLELLMVQAGKKGVQLSYNVGPAVPLFVSSDPSRLKQVLQNVLANALKFTSSGSVTARCTVDTTGEVECQPGEVALLFEVEDTGIGMTPAEQTLLFLPFSQVDGSTTRHFGGTGLGLSICLQLVKLLGGTIGVDSQVGKGSRFHFTIPVQAAPTPESIAMDAEAATLTRTLLSPTPPTILIVSSSAATITFANTILRGCTIVSVPDLSGARVALSSSRFGFVLLDLKGEDDLAEIRSQTSRLAVRPWIVHFSTPTLETMKTALLDAASKKDVYRSNPPIRRKKLVQLLIELRGARSGEGVKDEGVVQAGVPAVVRTVDRFTEEEKAFFRTSRILIAEDNPVAAKLLVKTLERLNLQVTATTNGEEAIDAWNAQDSDHFSLCLFDSHMPLRDGPSAAARIRVLESKRGDHIRVPIVGLSADCQQSARLLAYSSGMQSYLSKPLRSADLVHLLREYVLPRMGRPPPQPLVNGKNDSGDGSTISATSTQTS